MKRHQAREAAFQILFQMDMNDVEPKEALAAFAENQQIDTFTSRLVEGVYEHKQEVDEKIIEKLENWSFQRVAAVEKAILRIAVFEILYIDEIPKKVSINEAVELGKKYGDDHSGRFINGVLSKIDE
ncbi:N utilization substance protein B [Compostibacillus humi]|uniref:Transcription antitermination protein NusB n=1 Tax=Compostibacillus humi TaxID=1245525 RepID=A0A8J2XGJ1_9BACI|nr:transcription antitermination factor NusB [Compostibacillus humi]GFZ88784.1 N utilization substance protein B [Compostibacillus humi]HLT56636.1 transcription antitermination factor NusB [Bacillota bacterium]